MNHEHSRKKNGFTLIEIVLAMAILSLVVMAVYNFLLAGNRTFYSGSNQYDAQSEMRMVSDYIIKNTRFASDISLQSSLDSPLDVDYNYMYVNNGLLTNYSTNGSTHIMQQTGGHINSSSFTLTTTNRKIMMNISLSKNSGDRTYQLQTNTEIPNMSLKGVSIATSGTVIKYSKSLEHAYTPTSPSTSATSSTTASTTSATVETTAPPTLVTVEFYTLVDNYNNYTLTLTSSDVMVAPFIATPIGNPKRLFRIENVPVNMTYSYQLTHMQGPSVIIDKWGTIDIAEGDYRLLLDRPD